MLKRLNMHSNVNTICAFKPEMIAFAFECYYKTLVNNTSVVK